MDKPTRERFTAWITKYALTDGIIEMRVELCSDISPNMICSINNTLQCYHGDDWHRTREDALKRATKMQTAKLKSLDSQKARIAALKFE